MMDFEDDDVTQGLNLNEDVELLHTHWIQEEAAPEILPYQPAIIDDLIELVEQQQVEIDNTPLDTEVAFTSPFYQMELDRVKYALSRYLACRVKKIEKNILQIATTPELQERLSAKEKEFAGAYVDIVDNYYTSSAIQELPENFRSLTVQNQEEQMIDEADLDSFVFCRVKEDVGMVQVDDSARSSSQVSDMGSTQELKKGDVHILKYRVAKPLLTQGQAHLI